MSNSNVTSEKTYAQKVGVKSHPPKPVSKKLDEKAIATRGKREEKLNEARENADTLLTQSWGDVAIHGKLVVGSSCCLGGKMPQYWLLYCFFPCILTY